jgi:WD40 repeat protein
VTLTLPSDRKTTLAEHAGPESRALFSPDGQILATAHEDGEARLWRTATGERVAIMQGHGNAVEEATFSPDSRWLLTGDANGEAKLFPTTKEAIVDAAWAALDAPPPICATR